MNSFQESFNKQKAYFDSDATKSYEWRIDQLTRLENLCNENSANHDVQNRPRCYRKGHCGLAH